MKAIWNKWLSCKVEKGAEIFLSALCKLQRGMAEEIVWREHADAAVARLLHDFARAFDL